MGRQWFQAIFFFDQATTAVPYLVLTVNGYFKKDLITVKRKPLIRCSRHIIVLLLLLHFFPAAAQQEARQYLRQGWAELVNDNDTAAMLTFARALEQARQARDTPAVADALLYMGICSYGSSYTYGMKYAKEAMGVYRQLEKNRPDVAALGRSRCLQLISTLYSRQGKYKEAALLSREAMEGLPSLQDTTGTLGLIYNSLGTAFSHMGQSDSAAYYYRLSLAEHQRTYNKTYLPTAYLKAGYLALDKGQQQESRQYFERALSLSDSTGNRQARVSALLAMAKWYRQLHKNRVVAMQYLEQAGTIAAGLSDKSYAIAVLQEYTNLYKEAGDYRSALEHEEEMLQLKNTYYDLEKERIVKGLETEFRLSEKDRQLALVHKEKQVIRLSNYLLWGGILILLVVSSTIILFQRRINKKNRQLLHAREQVRKAEAEQQEWKERQLKNDLEHKEAQLSAMALQMYQKNELMRELKEKLEQSAAVPVGNEVNRILNRGLNQDREWADFDTRFESLNRNFYTRLKQHFPGISPNDLKICALIKLNLSIKEMAGILNISPDSVKTARYRLRKKLQLNTEDNLTDFILNLE